MILKVSADNLIFNLKTLALRCNSVHTLFHITAAFPGTR